MVTTLRRTHVICSRRQAKLFPNREWLELHEPKLCSGAASASQLRNSMIDRSIRIALALGMAIAAAGCHHNKVNNPIANIDSKQPDKVLFDRAMDAMKHGKYDVARITLQTLINTYPDSEFIARAKLAVGDSWYAEGTTAAYQQAEVEYK